MNPFISFSEGEINVFFGNSPKKEWGLGGRSPKFCLRILDCLFFYLKKPSSILYYSTFQQTVTDWLTAILPPTTMSSSHKLKSKKKLKTLPSQAEEDHVEASDQGAVPPPKQLTLERQLNKSILIGGSDDLTAMVMMISKSIVISRIFYKIFFPLFHYFQVGILPTVHLE